jgi:hypothetical protein
MKHQNLRRGRKQPVAQLSQTPGISLSKKQELSSSSKRHLKAGKKATGSIAFTDPKRFSI